MSGKLRSKWIDPFVVTNVFPYGTVEIKSESTDKSFKVNGDCSLILLILLGQLPILNLAVVVGTMKKAAAAIKRHIKNQTFIVSVCHTLISSRDCHLLKFSSLLAELSCLMPFAVQYERFFDVS